MPHYLVTGHIPDNFDPSTQSEETVHNIDMFNDELEAAGAPGLSLPASAHPAWRSRCGRSPMAKCSSPTDRIWKPRSTLAVLRYWNPLTWTRRSSGRAKSVIACRMPVEVREIPYSNPPHGTPHPSRQPKP